MTKKISLMVICLCILTFSFGFSDGVNKNVSVTSDNLVEPTYVAHYCHLGNQHERCLNEIQSIENCGCGVFQVFCCCGRTMGFGKMYCSKHGYEPEGDKNMESIDNRENQNNLTDKKQILNKIEEAREIIRNQKADKNIILLDENDKNKLIQEAEDISNEIKNLNN